LTIEADLLDGVARDDGDEAHRLVDDDLDLRHQPVGLHVRDDSAQPITSADVRSLAVTAQTVDLGCSDDAPVARVARDRDPAGLVPAPERVEADPERRSSLARAVELLRHQSRCLGKAMAATVSDPCPLARLPFVSEAIIRTRREQ
jgi:hypothetical protein